MGRVRFINHSMKHILVVFLGVVSSLGAQSAYDLRDVSSGQASQSWVPDIQDQGIFNDCWTFASATAMNSNLLMNGVLTNDGTPPLIQISSWHLSTANGAPESLVGPNYGGSGNAEWGGFEYQALGYATRGSGSWAIPGVSPSSTTLITTMGGGPVLNSGNSLNPFPHVLQSQAPANIGDLIPPALQPQAFMTRAVRMWDQGYGNNQALPAPIHPGGDTYDFTLGAADPQVGAVKAAILAGGAVTTSMNASSYDYFINVANGDGTYTVQYFNPSKNPSDTDHEVTIIGWDDSYQMSNPNTGENFTGAWIVQNSWGRDNWVSSTEPYPNDGTFYAAYNDAAIARTGVASFAMESMGNYSPIVLQNELGPMAYAYNYDAGDNPLGMHQLSYRRAASILSTGENTTLLALGLASHLAGVDVTVNIYKTWANGPSSLLSTESFLLNGIGYQLNDLSMPLNFLAGDEIVLELIYSLDGAIPVVIGGTGINGYTDVTDGLSYYWDGAMWQDMAGLAFASNTQGVPDIEGGILFVKGVVAIPEPSAMMLILLGGIMAGLVRGRVMT